MREPHTGGANVTTSLKPPEEESKPSRGFSSAGSGLGLWTRLFGRKGKKQTVNWFRTVCVCVHRINTDPVTEQRRLVRVTTDTHYPNCSPVTTRNVVYKPLRSGFCCFIFKSQNRQKTKAGFRCFIIHPSVLLNRTTQNICVDYFDLVEEDWVRS